MDRNKLTEIQPYYYYRNGILHRRVTVDEAVELSGDEASRMYRELEEGNFESKEKQKFFRKAWNFYTEDVGREIKDGIKLADKIMEAVRCRRETSGR